MVVVSKAWSVEVRSMAGVKIYAGLEAAMRKKFCEAEDECEIERRDETEIVLSCGGEVVARTWWKPTRR